VVDFGEVVVVRVVPEERHHGSFEPLGERSGEAHRVQALPEVVERRRAQTWLLARDDAQGIGPA